MFFFLQVSHALADDVSTSIEDGNENIQLERRNSKKVAQMLQQILQRGEMQVEPYRIQKFLGNLYRRRNNELIKNPLHNYF